MNFVEFTIEVTNANNENLGLKPKYKDARIKIDIESIEAFREVYNDEGQLEGCMIYTKSGNSFWVNEDYPLVKNHV